MKNWVIQVVCLLSITQVHAAFNLTWGLPPTSLDESPPVGDSDLHVQTAINSLGDGVAVWSRTSGNGAGEDVWMASFNHTNRSWSRPVQISGGGNATNPAVKLDEKGNAILLWEEGFPTQIMYRTVSKTGLFKPDLSTQPLAVVSSSNAQIMPHLALDEQGNALAVWMEFYKDKYHIHSARNFNAQNWSHLGEISKGVHSAHLHFTPSLSINRSGNAVIAWQETNKKTGFSEVHGSIYLGGSWLPAFTISAESEQHSLFPSAGIDASNNIVFVWNHFGPINVIKSKTYRNGFLSDPITVSNPAFVAQRPHVAVDSMGNAVVVYERFDRGPSSTNAKMNKYIASATLPFKTSTWLPAVDISGPSPNSQIGEAAGYPVLALNSIGDGVAIWKEFNGSNMVVQSAGYSLGTWSLFRTISSKNGPFKEAYEMAVSINLAGNLLAVWPEDLTGTHTHYLKAATGVGLAAFSPMPPLPIPQPPDSQIVLPIVTLPPVQHPIVHPTISQPNLIAVKQEAKIAEPKVIPGKQTYIRFPCHGDLINQLNWSAPNGQMVSYRIYRGNLFSLIGETQDTQFQDHQRTPGVTETYFITAIDNDGHESSAVTIVVPPMK